MNADRSKVAWLDLQHLQDPLGPYARTYRAKVVAQSDDSNLVDVRPDDPSLPDMSKVPLRHGVPGLRVAVAMGSYLIVGWDDGRPDHPFAALWNPDVHATKVSFVADAVNLGSTGPSDALVKGDTFKTALETLLTALDAYSTAIAGIADPTSVATPLLKTAIEAFKKVPYLSTHNKTT